jgi:hypothetical protein
LDAQLRKATDAKKLANDARKLVERAQAIVIEEIASLPKDDATRSWKRAMGVDGSYLVPFTGFAASVQAETIIVDGGAPVAFTRAAVNGLLGADDPMQGQRRILAAAEELISNLAKILTRIQVWQGPGAVTIRAAIHQSLTDISDFVSNLKMLDVEATNFAEDTRRFHSFTEDEKVELFYRKPETPPVRDYLGGGGGGRYAEI